MKTLVLLLLLAKNLFFNIPQIVEKVYLHTDRIYYYPGDDIWFKAYLVDAYGLTLTENSNNLHVELLSPSQEILSARTIRLESGLGNGDFKLSEDLPAGKYRIRAYTNYMRNFSDQVFFNKEINIVKPSADIDKTYYPTEAAAAKFYISFFPEGGSLVDDVTSIVALKAVDEKGRGCDVSGSVYSSKGELITMFRSTHLGMGSFAIKPVPGLSYYAIVNGPEDAKVRVELPSCFSTGVALSTSLTNDNKLSIIVRTNKETLSGIKDSDLKLTVSVRNEIINTIFLRINSLSNALTLTTTDLPDGIITLTLTTTDDLPVAERLFFFQNDHTGKVSIKTDKNVYKQREPVTVNVMLSGAINEEETAFVSLSATDENFNFNPLEYATTISSWFLLESDVKGPVEGPSYYFDPANPDRLRDLDLLLMTQGWRDFSWKSDTAQYYSPENGFYVSGRIRRISTDKPIPGSRVQIMMFDEKGMKLETVNSDASGDFYLGNIDITGKVRLRASASNKNNISTGLLMLDSVRYQPAEVTEFITSLTMTGGKEGNEPVTDDKDQEKEARLKQNYEARELIRKQYRLSDTIEIGEVVVTAQKEPDMQTLKVESVRMWYGKPDNELIVTREMETLPAAPLLLMGTVAGVTVTDAGYGKYKIRIRSGIYRDQSPILLIDGIEKPLDVLNWLPVSAIDRIDILKTIGKTAVFGLGGNYGVISVITRIGNRRQDEPADTPWVVNTTIYGYDPSRVFYSPQHNPATPSGDPDLRTTLFWNPDIVLQKDRELSLGYFNADNSATIRIIVEGITSTGIPVTATTEYEITK